MIYTFKGSCNSILSKSYFHYHKYRETLIARHCRLPLSGTRSDARNVQAVAVVLASRHNHISPCPVRATRAATGDDDVVSITIYCIRSRDAFNGQIRDWDTTGGRASVKVTTIIVLLNQYAVTGRFGQFLISTAFNLSEVLWTYSDIAESVISW